jgi:PAS domain S-box-containing protein
MTTSSKTDPTLPHEIAEKAVEQLDAMLRHVSEHHSDGLLHSLNGVIVFANSTMAKILGADSGDALIGKNLNGFVDLKAFEAVEAGTSNYLAWRRTSGETVRYETTVKRVGDSASHALQIIVHPDIRSGRSRVARSEDELRRSEARLSGIIESAMDGIITVDESLRMVLINPAAEKMFNIDKSEYLGKPVGLLIPERFRKRHDEHIRRFGQMGETSRRMGHLGTIFGLRSDGSEFPLEASISQVEGDSGKLYTVVLRDVSERLHAETSLRESEQKYRNLFNRAPIGIYRSQKDSTIVDVNEHLVAMLGYDAPTDLIGRRMGDTAFLSMEERDRIMQKALVTGRIDTEVQWKKKDGSLIWVGLSLQLLKDNPDGAYVEGFVRDITQRRRAESRFEKLFRSAPVAIGVGMLDGTILDVNERCLHMFGYTREEFVGHRAKEIGIWVDPEKRLELIRQLQRDGTVESSTMRFRRKNGKEGVALVSMELLPGEVDQYVIMMVDITSSEAARRKIVQQATLLDAAHDAISVRGLDHRVQYWNHGAFEMYGWTPEEALDRDIREFLCVDTKDYGHALQACLTDGAWSGEQRKQHRDGRTLIIDSRWTLVNDESGQPQSILVIDSNITEKKNLQEQLLRAQRLESVGTLASGLAHDLNNLLNAISLATHVLKKRLPPGDEILQTIESSVQRGADIIRQVLLFTRGSKGEHQLLRFQDLLKDVQRIVTETFPKSIEFDLQSPADLALVRGDATQLHQVLLNLCVNARDAMPSGGRLSIVAENIELDESYASMVPGAKPGWYVHVKVSDTGTGMTAEVVDRIFDPFYTTKEPGKGSGLGLSSSLGIVKSHDGFMRVDSEPGRGASFSIYLPAVTGQVDSPAESATVPEGHGELVLIVDDERDVRMMLKKTLESHGYQTLIASDGIEGIALFAENRTRVRAIIMDLMMPNMDGVTTAKAIAKIDPYARIIAVSGLQKGGFPEFPDKLLVAALHKPYTAEKILMAIHQAVKSVT